MRIGGLDVGDRRIGVAISDEMGWTPQGVGVVTRSRLDGDLASLRTALAPYAPTTLVVGLPRNMNGTLQAEKVSAFAREAERVLEIPVVLRDERLSTVGAERALLEADVSRAKRRKVIDKLAAVFILQGYLGSLRFAGRAPE